MLFTPQKKSACNDYLLIECHEKVYVTFVFKYAGREKRRTRMFYKNTFKNLLNFIIVYVILHIEQI